MIVFREGDEGGTKKGEDETNFHSIVIMVTLPTAYMPRSANDNKEPVACSTMLGTSHDVNIIESVNQGENERGQAKEA